ncbi:MAG: FecR family protein [Hyphomicrobiales bacterium]
MFDKIKAFAAPMFLAIALLAGAGSAANAQDATWRVRKASGDAVVMPSGGQAIALTDGAAVKPGDSVRTGQTGRVLLVRGEETMLISPNSTMSIPADKRSGLSTVIVQQAGSILFDVEKRNVKHFSVETPYLAAVVKGTQFRVTVNQYDSRVDVLGGQVEVTDFKSGQFALVKSGQAAQVEARGKSGLSLSGSGSMPAVQQGTPRTAMVGPAAGSDAMAAYASAANASSANAPAVMSEGMNRPAMALETSPPPVAPKSASVQASSPVISMAAPAARTWAPDPNAKGTGWSAIFGSSGKSENGEQRRSSRNEDIAIAVGFSCALGLLVSLSVGAVRRRRSKKMTTESQA